MGCTVKTGKYLATAGVELTTYGTGLATSNYMFSAGKLALGDLIHEKGSNAKLVKFAIQQTLTTSSGVLVTTALQVHIYYDQEQLTSSTQGSAYELGDSAIPIGTFTIGDSSNDWVMLDDNHSFAEVELNMPIWSESDSKAIYFSIQTAAALGSVTDNTINIIGVSEMN